MPPPPPSAPPEVVDMNQIDFAEDLHLLSAENVLRQWPTLLVLLTIDFVWLLLMLLGRVRSNESAMRKHSKYYDFWRKQVTTS